MKKTVKIGRPGYRVTKQFDPDQDQRSLLFQVSRCCITPKSDLLEQTCLNRQAHAAILYRHPYPNMLCWGVPQGYTHFLCPMQSRACAMYCAH